MRSRLGAIGLMVLLGAGPVAADEVRSWPDVLQVFGGGAFLGVQLDDVDDGDVARLKLRDERGARVTGVDEGSPAAEAGLRKDDVVTAFDGEGVRSAAALARLVRETPPGRTVKIEIVRGGAREVVTAEMRERHRRRGDLVLPTDPPALLRDLPSVAPRPRPAPRRLGIGYRDVSAADATRLGLPRPEGVVVTSVEPASPAEQAGLRKDDVIISVDGRSVASGAQLRHTIHGYGGAMTLAVVRGGETRELTVRFDDTADGPRKM